MLIFFSMNLWTTIQLILLSSNIYTSSPVKPKKFLTQLKTEKPDTKLMNEKDWKKDDEQLNCLSRVFREPIVVKDCEPRFVKNRYCYGQCNSVYIPQMFGNFKNCKACVPSIEIQKTIRIRCNKFAQNKNETKYLRKTITLVKECKCQDVVCDK